MANKRVDIKIMPLKAVVLFKKAGFIDDTMAVIYILNQYKVKDELNIVSDTELWLDFDDILNPIHIGAMRTHHAEKIKKFVMSLNEKIEFLIICCAGGFSRSPAIAAGILKGLGQSDLHIWKNPSYSPNVLCYKMMMKTFGKSGCSVYIKKKISEYAFRKTVRKNAHCQNRKKYNLR